MAADHYTVLGLSQTAGQDDVLAAFDRIKARLAGYAPGLVFSDADVAQLLPEKWAAYQVLSDPEGRRLYDQWLASPVPVSEPPAPGSADLKPSRWSALLSYAAFIGFMTAGVIFLLLLAGYLL